VLIKDILWFGRICKLVCDGRCDKAWGIASRPSVYFDETGEIVAETEASNPDDYAFLADSELGIAPDNPGTYEGGHGKPSATPLADSQPMNKWCARECERSNIIEAGEPVVRPDFSHRRYNLSTRNSGWS
jgi:hypothetical protein